VRWAEPGDAAAVADRIAAELAKPGPKRIAVPGGSTPVRCSRCWPTARSTGPAHCLTDDRQVPDDHPASNYGKLVAALGDSGVTVERLVEGAASRRSIWCGWAWARTAVASLFPHMHALVRPGRR
jgi:6-phosphogluconolactonase